MMVEILLILSVALNIFAVWYVRELLVRFKFYSENTTELFTNLQEYTEHLEKVNQIEVFFGDPTIQCLLEHSRDVTGVVAEYLEIFSLEEEGLVGQTEEEE